MVRKQVRNALLVIISLFSFSLAAAQVDKGERLFKKMAYVDAIKAYEKALTGGETNFLRARLGDCYAALNEPTEAIQWYRKAAESGSADPKTILAYADLLKSRARYRDAKYWYEQYGSATGDYKRANLMSQSCDDAEEMRKNPDKYTIQRLGLSSAYDEFSAVRYRKGIAFSASRPRGFFVKWLSGRDGQPFYDLYYVEENLDGSFSKPKLLKGKINSRFHDGPVSFTKSQDIAFVTRNRLQNGKDVKDSSGITSLAIYMGRKENDKWGDFKMLNLCEGNYSCAHPALAADEKTLFFSSDMPGGYGGNDIWFSVLEKGKWSKAINLGPEVNTPGNELFPTIDASGVLYFSSDGHPGLGGLDIFSAKTIGAEWKDVKNMGFALNTEADEFGLIIDVNRAQGYFTSDREGGAGGDDIYYFKLSSGFDIQVVEAWTGKAVPNAKVSMTSASGTGKVIELTANKEGRIEHHVKTGKDYWMMVEAEGFKKYKEKISSKGISPGEVLSVAVQMEKAPVFSLGIRVWDRKDGWPLDKVPVRIIGESEEMYYTNPDGWLEVPLKPESQYTVIVEYKDYLPMIEKIGTGKKENAAPIELEMVLDHKPHAMLEGVVLDGDGVKIENAKITVQERRTGVRLLETVTQGDGVFWLVVDSIEDVMITAAKEGFVSKTEDVKLDFGETQSQSVRFVLLRDPGIAVDEEPANPVDPSDNTNPVDEEDVSEFDEEEDDEEEDDEVVASADPVINSDPEDNSDSEDNEEPQDEPGDPIVNTDPVVSSDPVATSDPSAESDPSEEEDDAGWSQVSATPKNDPPSNPGLPATTSLAPTAKKNLTLYYDNNSTEIRRNYIGDLELILQVMKEHPNAKLKIEGHSDAKGYAALNKELSEKRARSIAWFFKARGIDKSRLDVSSYGSKQLVNDCRSKGSCPDWKHQENRRTVVTVIGGGPIAASTTILHEEEEEEEPVQVTPSGRAKIGDDENKGRAEIGQQPTTTTKPSGGTGGWESERTEQ